VINEVAEQWSGAVITMTEKGVEGTMTMPAAHVFDADGGFAFIDPDYFYAETAHLNNFHRIAGEITKDGDGFRFTGPRFSGTIQPWEASVEQLRTAGDALYRLEYNIEEAGATFASERAQAFAILRDELASR
jgi:hypothetical protein